MSYLASIYACLLALFGALVMWALPMVVYAAVGSIRAWHHKRLALQPARSAQLPKTQPVFRRSEVSIH